MPWAAGCGDVSAEQTGVFAGEWPARGQCLWRFGSGRPYGSGRTRSRVPRAGSPARWSVTSSSVPVGSCAVRTPVPAWVTAFSTKWATIRPNLRGMVSMTIWRALTSAGWVQPLAPVASSLLGFGGGRCGLPGWSREVDRPFEPGLGLGVSRAEIDDVTIGDHRHQFFAVR